MRPMLVDLNLREFGMMVPLVVLVFWIGLYPKPLLDVMHASVDRLVQRQAQVMTVDQGISQQGAADLSFVRNSRIESSSPTKSLIP